MTSQFALSRVPLDLRLLGYFSKNYFSYIDLDLLVDFRIITDQLLVAGASGENFMVDLGNTKLRSLEIGAVPLIEHFLNRLNFRVLFDSLLLRNRLGRPVSLLPSRTLSVLICNLLLSRQPLYAVPKWLARYMPETFGLETDQLRWFNDDRIGRELDRLFEVNHASTLTELIVIMIDEFGIELDRFHNDSTTITFSGNYENQKNSSCQDRPPLITFGRNKDHRPDLKQLLWTLTVSADGAVPVLVGIDDGNTTDDSTHIQTWTTLVDLVGHPRFVYVADSKLCTIKNMRFIDGKDGIFLTVMPATRKEDGWFKQYVRKNEIDWQEVRRDRNHRGKSKPDIVYHAVESPQSSAEGFRIFWYRSSQKIEQDQHRRSSAIRRARQQIEQLNHRKGRGRLRSEQAAQQAVDAILEMHGVARFLDVTLRTDRTEQYKQQGKGRPSSKTIYQRKHKETIRIEVRDDIEAIKDAAIDDGLFPLITNHNDISAKEALDFYKYQPFLEKRFEQLKNAFDGVPIFLKKPERIASLLFLDFIVMLIEALIERELRAAMKAHGIKSMPLYPESRHCKAPTAKLVFDALAGFRLHQIIDSAGTVLKTYYDHLEPTTRTVLELLGIDLEPYGITR